MLKTREGEIEKKEMNIGQVLKRETDLKDQLTKMEFLYDLDPNKPLIKYGKE
jgi:hypothetical protein